MMSSLPCFAAIAHVQVCKLPFTDVPRHYRNIQVRAS